MSEKKHTIFGFDPATGPGSFVRATFTGAGELVHLETWPERWDEEKARALQEQLDGLDFSRQYLGQLPSERGGGPFGGLGEPGPPLRVKR